ncbi:MAG: hypothetical protein STSR0008_00100 [Ignavibacterium sp.]
MKKIFTFFLILLNFISYSQNYPHIFELRGFEDSLNNTHLFYRYGEVTFLQWYSYWNKSIYHFDVKNKIDTLFVRDESFCVQECMGLSYYDYEFFDNDPTKYILVGFEYDTDPWVAIFRNDGPIYVPIPGLANEVEISKQNKNLLFITTNENGLIKSIDGGLNWINKVDSIALIDYSMISLSKNDDSQIYGIDSNYLVRSEDEGKSYIIVDNSSWSKNTDLFYDTDGNHIYGLSNFYDEQYETYFSKISISDNNGNPYSWHTTVEYQGTMYFTLDENKAGEIYYSAGRKIFKSTDFGTTFNLYKELDKNVTGLYKKPSTDILYASTSLKIYQITLDTIQVLKELPIPERVFDFYPLAIGNKWVYDVLTFYFDEFPHSYGYIKENEVLKDSVAPNGKTYRLIKDIIRSESTLERIDSSTGLIFRYSDNIEFPEKEYVIDDLLAEVGDTVKSFRFGYPWDGGFTTLLDYTTFEKFGLSKQKKIFEQYDLSSPRYSLTEDIGLDSLFHSFDFGYTEYILKGCIIDGVVYGDTTVVDVENETSITPTKFSLSQNYPNPFNPNTTIRFQIPERTFVTLKIYDILGKEVATLVNEEKSAGEYELEFSGNNFTSGLYFYQLKARNYIETKKMILVK